MAKVENIYLVSREILCKLNREAPGKYDTEGLCRADIENLVEIKSMSTFKPIEGIINLLIINCLQGPYVEILENLGLLREALNKIASLTQFTFKSTCFNSIVLKLELEIARLSAKDMNLYIDDLLTLKLVDVKQIKLILENNSHRIISRELSNSTSFISILQIIKNLKKHDLNIYCLANSSVCFILNSLENSAKIDSNLLHLISEIDSGKFYNRILSLYQKHNLKFEPLSLKVITIEFLLNYLQQVKEFHSSDTNSHSVKVYKLNILGTDVALKLTTDLNIDTFNQESKALEILSGKKPCFLLVHKILMISNSMYVLSEYMKDSLETELNTRKSLKNPYTDEENKEMFQELLEGFAYMKSLNLYHRDIKPSNILKSLKKLKIIDFSVSEQSSTSFGEFKVKGTPDYAAPEIAPLLRDSLITGSASAITYDLEKADVFSLGLVFLEVMTLQEIHGLNNTEEPQKLESLIDSFSEWKNKLLSKMLSTLPENRCTFSQALAFIPLKNTVAN